MKTTNLDKWLYLVRRIEEHREEKAVRELQKLYRSLIKDLRKVMGNIYADYADPETGKLTYADLHRQGLDARLLEEVAAHVSSVSSEEIRIIRETVEQTYANCYSGMVQAVGKAVDNEELKEAFSAVEAVKPEVLRAAVNNPVHGLTLSDQLEKNRADIVWGIKQAVGVGLSEGDNYTTMAKRIQKELIGPDGSGGSYYKAVRIARTEAHRVREEGNLDAAQNLTEKLEPAGMTMVKTWHTMKDERVRPNRARKTKGGWKYSKGGKYDHQKMEGVQVPINEEFTLPSGAKTQAPGKSGVAGEDINCRCFLSYDVVERLSSSNAEMRIRSHVPGQNINIDRTEVLNTITQMPPKVQRALAKTTIDIGKMGASQYDHVNDILYICKGAKQEEIVHEIGHLVEHKLCNNAEVMELKEKLFSKHGINDIVREIWYDTNGGSQVIFRVKDDSTFVTEYQSRIYVNNPKDAVDNNGKIRIDLALEFVSEPFKEYCNNPEYLKEKSPELYSLIERAVL